MLKKQICTSLFLILSLPPLQALAKTYTYRDTTEISIASTMDRDLGAYLASLVSFRKAVAQAELLIARQPFVEEARLSKEDIQKLAYLLIDNQLSYTSEASTDNPLKVVHKTKLEYDEFKFPTSMGKVYQEKSGDLINIKYRLAHDRKLEADIQSYFKALRTSQDEAYKNLLRESRGGKLLKKYRARQLKERAFELARNDRFDEAIKALNQAIEWDPEYRPYGIFKAFFSWESIYSEPRELESKGADRALKVFNELIKQHPNESDLYALRAVVYMVQNTIPAEGLKDTIKATELDNKNALAYMLMGILAHRTGKTATARLGLKKACELGIQDACGQNVLNTPKRIRPPGRKRRN